ncbi:hypothetical protein DOTSEDRAFT_30773 [Dothistroma septosporum NZE10]|uniref:Uncharacterized protein n=1 Tax=Dothistroma septosporum (strain NZE10 / CBS 128990) TaxID=675120 RepID=N1Q1E4_DOTSN|nr:hypothetical protein DOTSEDRAFT_30773 [Dothistroma septosporum NZE10]
MSSQFAASVTVTRGKLHVFPNQSRAENAEPVECWEDEADDSASQTEGDGTSTPVRPSNPGLPGAPPPTPSSPVSTRESDVSYQFVSPLDSNDAYTNPPVGSRSMTAAGEERRPDKTTSVASRLIAAGIGQKAPPRTKEEREYDQAMKIQEKKKRDGAREEAERKRRERENAQKAMWDE